MVKGDGMERKIYLEEEDVLHDAFRLGVQIYNDDFRPTFIVGLWRGGSTVGIAVQECLQTLGVSANHIAIRTSYTGMGEYSQMVENPANRIRIHGTHYLLESLNVDDQLLIIDDVYSSGLNVQAVIDRLASRLKRNMPAQVRVGVIWYKPGKKQTKRVPDYYLHETDDWLVLPYELTGLSREEILANKPYLAPILGEAETK
jgi:hypoxanthine phosphoribosyltransferase